MPASVAACCPHPFPQLPRIFGDENVRIIKQVVPVPVLGRMKQMMPGRIWLDRIFEFMISVFM